MDIIKIITKNNLYFWTFCLVIFPFSLWFGLQYDYWYREHFLTPKYEVYNLPLRTPFIGTCQIYGEYGIVSKDRKSIIIQGIDWVDCQGYKNLQEAKNKILKRGI